MKHGDQSGHQGCSASTGEGFVRKAGNYLLFLSVKRDRSCKRARFFADCAANKWPPSEQRNSGVKGIGSVLPLRQKMWLALNMPESLSGGYAELLCGNYDCADRVVSNLLDSSGPTLSRFSTNRVYEIG